MADEQIKSQGQLKDIKTEKAIVARGRSIDVPIPGKKEFSGTNKDGDSFYRLPVRNVGPGQEVELPIEEVRSLRAAGYLVDPDNIAPPVGMPGVKGDGPGQVQAV